MEFMQLTPEQPIPVLGLGTWHMGGTFTSDRRHDRKYARAIKYAISRGITHIDTAELYGQGHAEELIGATIKGHDRSKLFITSKVLPHHLTYRGVLAACDRSLKRLNTDYLDLYLIHWPNPLARMKRVMKAFDELVAAGKIRYIGVSNFSVEQMKEAQVYSRDPIVTNQVHYNLLHRQPETEVLPYCQAKNIIMTAYSPLEQGQILSPRYEILDKIGASYGKTRIQVALRWLLDQPQVITIPKSSSKAHIDENLGSLGWRLKPADIERLKKLMV